MSDRDDLAPGADPERTERARKLFSGPITFLKSAPALQHLPDPTMPEIAFAGRSNVGKSSLLNALTNRNGLARTSVTPGRTQELNYFVPDGFSGAEGDLPPMALVDMPGYGYARCSKEERHKWAGLLEHYLTQTPGLTALLLLLDGRLPPQS